MGDGFVGAWKSVSLDCWLMMGMGLIGWVLGLMEMTKWGLYIQLVPPLLLLAPSESIRGIQ